ncbi:hypothetical protein R3P38DRAFT_2925458 [Favolaschia claudopus]|uniref:Uncharacterized protein n=1 Tax=Favolaschia claudopus TaxID=2862362 RepID=A0AAW0C160_9AGAR
MQRRGRSTAGAPGGRRGGRRASGTISQSSAGDTTSNPSAKRSVDDDSDFEAPAANKKQKKTPQAPDPEPKVLPKRSNRNSNPAGPDMIEPRRTHEEVEQDKAIKAAAAEALLRQYDEALAEIAALQAEQDEGETAATENMVLSLADLDEGGAGADSDFVPNIVGGDDPELSSDTAVQAAPQPKKKSKKKPEKLETRQAIEKATATLAATKKGDVAKGKKKSALNSNSAAASKSAGLSKKFLASTTVAAAASTANGDDDDALGGLGAEDEVSARPAFKPGKSKSGAASRVNNVVAIVVGGESSEPEETPTRLEHVKPAPKRATKSKHTKTEEKIPALSLTAESSPALHTTVKAESSQLFFAPSSSDDVKGLPAVLGAIWDLRVLPAVYRGLYLSTDPMSFMAKGETDASKAAAVAAVQAIVDEVVPGNSLVVRWGDVVCQRMVCRARERRSAIALHAVEVVDEYFKDTYAFSTVMKVKTYARYAVRPDGPAFYREPTPEYCKCEPSAPGYIKGVDYLESQFMMDTVKRWMKGETFSIPPQRLDKTYDFGKMPAGLFALAAAGLERAFIAYSGDGIRPPTLPKFDKVNSGTAVRGYMKNIARFGYTRWSSLMTACKSPIVVVDEEDDDFAMGSLRDFIYLQSSP